jgi:hypothetical protein
MEALGVSEMAFWSPYSSQSHARSVARTPFQTVSEGNFSEVRIAEGPTPMGVGRAEIGCLEGYYLPVT